MVNCRSFYSKRFLKYNRLMLDTSILIPYAKGKEPYKSVVEKALNKYMLIFATPSILELGFGRKEQIDVREAKLAGALYATSIINPLNSMIINSPSFNNIMYPKQLIGYNPSGHEWLAAKNFLINIASKQGTEVKEQLKNLFDAIIYTCAWNANAAIITENLKDFLLLNSVQEPFYTTTKDLNQSPVVVDNLREQEI